MQRIFLIAEQKKVKWIKKRKKCIILGSIMTHRLIRYSNQSIIYMRMQSFFSECHEIVKPEKKSLKFSDLQNVEENAAMHQH